MNDYKVKYEEDKITISFLHISIIIRNPNKENIKKVKEIVDLSDNFRYVYRAISTNPNFEVEINK